MKASVAFVPVCRKALVLSIAVSLALSRENFYTVAMKISQRVHCRSCVRFVLAAFVFLVCAISISAADQTVVLKAARIFDGKSKSLIPNGVVVVQGDKIIDVGSNVAIPSDAKVIDLGDMTLSPGFMDAHTHLTLDFSGDFNKRRLEQLDLNVSDQAIRAVGYARTTVEAGFTTVRDVGSRFVSSREFVDVALRNAINK